MRFIVTIASNYSDDQQPCEEAIKGAETINNTTKERSVWHIDFNSLEELLKWRDKVDESIIIHKNWESECQYEIEIYDDWRE